MTWEPKNKLDDEDVDVSDDDDKDRDDDKNGKKKITSLFVCLQMSPGKPASCGKSQFSS